MQWAIKHNLVLQHISMRITRDGVSAVRGLDGEALETLLDMFIGTDTPEKVSGNIDNIDSKAIMTMSDDQRLELYNKIIEKYYKARNESA